MTLYYQDATIQTFTAQVVESGSDERGHYIALSDTAFYPTGGGQPHDTGWLNDVAVTNVEKVGEQIRHYVEENATLTGEVTGQLDWQRRFDHMQQHTGQHILTAAFVECFDLQTVSFHLGSELVTIDLDTPSITQQQLDDAEARANDIILENHPIETKWVTATELAQYNLRKEIAVEGDIRLVIIPDFDYNGCGGTHVASTGQVQMIKILETEKMKGGIRMHFACGKRVTEQLAMRKHVLASVARQLSVPEREAHTALTKILNTVKQSDKALADAREQLLKHEAATLVINNVAAKAFTGRSMQELQKLARFITAENPCAIALLVTENDDKLQFVAARGAEVASSMKAISGAALPLINGKGGGNDLLVQGGGEALLSAAQLLEKMQASI